MRPPANTSSMTAAMNDRRPPPVSGQFRSLSQLRKGSLIGTESVVSRKQTPRARNMPDSVTMKAGVSR